MAITDSGQIRFSDIANEYGVSLSNVSLSTLSTDIGLTPQHAITEFYGKSAGLTINDLTNTITADDDSVALSIDVEDAVYFDGYHFVSNRTSVTDASYYSDDDGISWTRKTSLFDQKSKFTVAGDYLITVDQNNLTRWIFGSEPNSISDTTYLSDLDIYRTRFSSSGGSTASNAIYYDDHVYYLDNSTFRGWDLSSGGFTPVSTGGIIYQGTFQYRPLAVGNDGRMITIGWTNSNDYSPCFVVTDNNFVTNTAIPFPSVSNYTYTSSTLSGSNFNNAHLVTDGDGNWVFTPRVHDSGRTLYIYSDDNGDTWTAIEDHYYDENVMTYTPGTTTTSDENFGYIESAIFANNKFYLGYASGASGSESDRGGLIFSSDGENLTGIKDIGTGARGLSSNGSTLIVAGDDKFLRFT